MENPKKNISASSVIQSAIKHMDNRRDTYAKGEEGERNMARIVNVFNAFHDLQITEAQGWHFMQILKDVRLFSAEQYHSDSAEDCVAYAGLKAEAIALEKEA